MIERRAGEIVVAVIFGVVVGLAGAVKYQASKGGPLMTEDRVDLAGRYFVARPYGGLDEARGRVVGLVSGDTWLVSLDADREMPARLHLVALDVMHGWDFYDAPATVSANVTGHAVPSAFAPPLVTSTATARAR